MTETESRVEPLANQQFEASQHPRVSMKVKKLPHFRGELCQYQSKGASGMDVRAQLLQSIKLRPGERRLIPTGLAFEVPLGFELQARPRSGWAVKEGVSLVNTPGTIDADYRGEVQVLIINLGAQEVLINDQDRIAQLVLCPVVQAQLIEIESLSSSDRGENGFGSTGKM